MFFFFNGRKNYIFFVSARRALNARLFYACVPVNLFIWIYCFSEDIDICTVFSHSLISYPCEHVLLKVPTVFFMCECHVSHRSFCLLAEVRLIVSFET